MYYNQLEIQLSSLSFVTETVTCGYGEPPPTLVLPLVIDLTVFGNGNLRLLIGSCTIQLAYEDSVS